jgi:hypothetical protein
LSPLYLVTSTLARSSLAGENYSLFFEKIESQEASL